MYRSQPRVILRLEEIEPRIVMSASPLMEQWVQQMAAVQQEYVSIWNTIAQEVRHIEQELGLLPANPANTSNQVNAASLPRASTEPATASAKTPTAPTDGSKSNDQGVMSPLIGTDEGYLWDPRSGTNASNWENWDYMGQVQIKDNQHNPTIPGQTLAPVFFDPKATTVPGLNGNGGSAITWDYSPKGVIAITLGPQSAYSGLQTINSGFTIDASVNAANTASTLNLDFADATSKFQIDGNSTITNMTLAGDRNGQFIINSGTTTIAQSPGYTDKIGVDVSINLGATLYDESCNALVFSNNNTFINIYGEMDVLYGTGTGLTLIDSNGYSNDEIYVYGGKLKYNGRGGVQDTFTVPIALSYGGTLIVTSNAVLSQGAWLTVEGANQFTNNASVSNAGPSTSVQLSQGATLECVNDYYQSHGTLATTDTTRCTLFDGASGTGTVNINSGVVAIALNTGSVGELDVTCGTMNFSGQYTTAIVGNTGSPGQCDLLKLNQGTINLQNAPPLYVNVYGTPKPGNTWIIIKAQFLTGDFAKPIQTNPQTTLNATPNPNGGQGQYWLSF
jgi:hypothetical protein